MCMCNVFLSVSVSITYACLPPLSLRIFDCGGTRSYHLGRARKEGTLGVYLAVCIAGVVMLLVTASVDSYVNRLFRGVNRLFRVLTRVLLLLLLLLLLMLFWL